MAFDYKKEYREFYLPGRTPEMVDVPEMNFAAVRGAGNPNVEGGAYQASIALLYGVSYTVKMSPRSGYGIDGFFDYAVPPLEGFWWQEGTRDIDYAHKENFCWISAIRLPDFVSRADFDWAVGEASRKKKADFSAVEFFTYTEGLCVQCMHLGPYDDEPATIALMDRFARAGGFTIDVTPPRHHHEIYLKDARRCVPSRLKTVIRHPVRAR